MKMAKRRVKKNIKRIKKNNKWIEWYKNGKIKSIEEYKEDTACGKWFEWNEAGLIGYNPHIKTLLIGYSK